MMPVVQHIKHAPTASAEIWHALGTTLAENFRPPFSLSEDTMLRYANETLTIIHELSEKVCI
jgi:hypothetical protein